MLMDTRAEKQPGTESHPSILWHPDVHINYGELLSFIFLKVEQYGPKFFEHLEAALAAARLPGYCYYDVFGSADVLLRVWSRSDSRHKLLGILDRMSGVSIRSIFVCSDTPKYLWWKECPSTVEGRTVYAYSAEELRDVQQGSRPD